MEAPPKDTTASADTNPPAPSKASAEPIPTYLTPQRLLVWATVFNFVLIFGGTIYSQITVQSIHKAYQEAQAKIDDSRSKFRDAEAAFVQQREKATQARADVETMLRSFEKLDAQLAEMRKEGVRKLDSISDEARGQLTLLKVERSNIGTSMAAIGDELRRTIDNNKITVQREVDGHVRAAKDELVASRKLLDTLSGEISALKVAIESKRNEITTLQLTSAQTLQRVRVAEDALQAELARLQKTGRINVALAWENSDSLLKTIYVVAATLAALGFVLSIIANIRKRS